MSWGGEGRLSLTTRARTLVAEAPGNIDWSEIFRRSIFWHQDPAPPNNLWLQSWKTSGQTTTKIGIQPHPSEDRLPKVLLSSHPPQNTPLDMALPIRGTRPSCTHERAGTSPFHQEGCTSPWTKLTHQGADTRSKRTTVLQPVERTPQTQKVRQNEMTEKYVTKEGTR